MKNKKKVLNFVIILLFSFILSSCATAPKGYLNKGRYLYVKGNKNEASIVFTAKLFNKLYSLPFGKTCPLDLAITQLNYKYAGWKGVWLLEILPGSYVIYIGIVGWGIPNHPLHVKSNKVYLLNCDAFGAWIDEIMGAVYIPQKKLFIYEGREYRVP